jgi:phospholipase C
LALSDIETIVIVTLENRSFDHMLGYLSLPDANPPMPVEGLRSEQAWLDAHANEDFRPNRPAIAPTQLDATLQTIDDPPHNATTIDIQINTPAHSGPPSKMGGFVKSYGSANPTNPALVMGYYKAAAVPTLDFFARNFTVCDNWFCPLPAGTQPNRLMLMSGTSRLKDNATLALPKQPLVYDWLDANQIQWCSYQWAGYPFFTLMLNWAPTIIGSLNDRSNLGSFRRYEGFHDQWNAGQTPAVIFIEPKYTDDKIGWAAPNDDHPPSGVAKGQDFLKEIYRTLTSNPARWAKTMLIVTYDEHGGFFDHVEPLPIVTTAGGYRFRTTGPRVPALVISPHVAPGTVFHNKLDHTSILQLLADRFTPGQPYSAAVAGRQQQLEPLSAVLLPAPAPEAAVPAMPPSMRALTHILAATAPVSPVGPTAPKDTETAKAFDHVAHEIARRYPELLTGPAGQGIANYVAKIPVPGGSMAIEMVTPIAAAPQRTTKTRRKAKTPGKAKTSKPQRRAKAKRKSKKSGRRRSRRTPA